MAPEYVLCRERYLKDMRLRIRFSKHGPVRYIGHLDIQRYFQRLNRRSGLKVVYSEGFSPHQKMSFAMPLSVGCESDAEYFDLEVSEAASSGAVINAMNSHQAEGILVTGCVLLPDNAQNAMASVRAADYAVSFRTGYEPGFDMEAAVAAFNASDSFIILKENKKAAKKKRSFGSSDTESPAFKELDLKKYVYGLCTKEDNTVFMRVSAGSADNIKPELVIKALYEKAGKELPPAALLITRKELYTDNMLSLRDVGQVF